MKRTVSNLEQRDKVSKRHSVAFQKGVYDLKAKLDRTR